LILAIQELESMGSSNRLDLMKKELDDVVRQIDRINMRRELLTSQKEIFSHAMKVLGKEDAPIDIQLLRQCIENHYNKASDEVMATKPMDLLAKKHKLARQIRECEQVAELSRAIREEL